MFAILRWFLYLLLQLRFPSGLSIAEVLLNGYGTDLVKNLRKLEKIGYKYCKLHFNLDFSQTCQHSKDIPKFLQFKLANRNLRSSSVYNTCQKRLLKEEINIKKNKIKQHLLKRNSIMKQPQSEISKILIRFQQSCTTLKM